RQDKRLSREATTDREQRSDRSTRRGDAYHRIAALGDTLGPHQEPRKYACASTGREAEHRGARQVDERKRWHTRDGKQRRSTVHADERQVSRRSRNQRR